MASGSNRDVRIRLSSSWEGAGFELATRETTRFERDYRRMAQTQMRAADEMAAAEARKAAAFEAASKRQYLAMEGAGRVLLGAAGATAAGLALATSAAIDWESAWAGVKKTVDGSPEQMAALEEQLRNLATTLPSTHTEIAAVAEAAGQLGIARGDIAAFTETAIALGETTNLSADQAATSLAQLMNIMKTAPDQVDELGSTLVALGNDGASTEADIVSMALRLAGAGELIGATEGEILATASALSSMGVSAEAGGGATSRTLQRIYSAMAEGGDKVEAFAEVAGMSASDFAAAWEEDPIRALAAFADGLNGVEDGGGNVIQTLKELGIRSSEEQRIILQLKANADLLTDSLDLQSTAWEENNALQDEAAQRYATTEAKLQMARNQINDAAIDIGGTFLPVVADTAEWVGQLAEGFSQLPAPAQEFLTTMGAATTGLGLLTGGAAIVIPKLAELSTTIKNLRGPTSMLGNVLGGTASLLTGPWGIALAGAAVGLAIFMQKQGEAKQRVEALRATLDEQTAAITENTRATVAENLSEVRSMWEGIFDAPVGATRMSALEGAELLGLDLQTLTDAALGNEDALAAVNARLEETRVLLDDSSAATEMGADKYNDLQGAVVAVDTGLQIQSNTLDGAIEKQELINEATGAGADAMTDAAGATEGAAEATSAYDAAAEAAAEETEELNTQIDELIDLMETMNQPTLNTRDAIREWEASLDAVSGAIEENGTSLDASTEAGRANQEVLDGLAQNAMALAGAILEETGSEEKFRSSLEKSRQKLFEVATQFGLSEDEAWAYVDAVLAVPPTVDTVVTVDTGSATQQIEWWINNTTGQRIKVYVDQYQGNTYDYTPDDDFAPNAQARGSVMEFYAGGGMRNLTPMQAIAQVVSPNTYRVVGDRPDVPESYIPHDGSSRSLAILGETMRRFGVEAAPQIVVPQPAGRSTQVDVHVGQVVSGTPQDIGAEIGWQLLGTGS